MSTFRTLAMSGVVLITTVLVSSCGDDKAKDLRSGDVHVLVSAPADGGDDMAIHGVVRLIGKCLGIGNEVAFWPSGTSVVSDDPLTIDVPGLGSVRVGDEVTGVGGSHSYPANPSTSTDEPEVPIPGSCPTSGWIDFRPE